MSGEEKSRKWCLLEQKKWLQQAMSRPQYATSIKSTRTYLGGGCCWVKTPIFFADNVAIVGKKIRKQLVGRFGSKRHNCDIPDPKHPTTTLGNLCPTDVGHRFPKTRANMRLLALVGGFLRTQSVVLLFLHEQFVFVSINSKNRV